MTLTAATITDEQIRELMQTNALSDRLLLQDCRDALMNLSIGYCLPHERRNYERVRRDARARCAEILNADARAT